MKAWLAQNLFYPVQDRLCGRRSLRYARNLEISQWWSAEQLQALQNAKLRRIVRHAVMSVPFYTRRFAELDLDVAAVSGIGDLAALPLLSKDDVRACREDLCCRPQRTRLILSCTSGSTGSPLIFHVCRRREQSDIAGRIRARRWFGVRVGDPGIYLWGARIETSNQDRLRMARDWLINERLLSAFTLSEDQMHRYADCFRRIRPSYAYAYASSLWQFARFVHRSRPDVKGAIGSIAFTSGEQLLPLWRRQIRSLLGCPVAEEYGCREGGLIAHQCPEGGHHITAENIVVEILDHEGQPLPSGQEGRVVITNLEADGMPFIRYDTGDRAALRNSLCACGRGLPLMHRPTGRSFEMLETNDGTQITGVCLSRDLKEIDGIAHYRVIQEARDRVRVLVVPDQRFEGAAAHDRIRQIVLGRIGPRTQVVIQNLRELPPHPSGKYRYVVNAMEPTSSIDTSCRSSIGVSAEQPERGPSAPSA